MGNYWLDLDSDERLEKEVKEFIDKFNIWDNIEKWETVLRDGDLIIKYTRDITGITAVYKESVPLHTPYHVYFVDKGTSLDEAIAGLLNIHYELKEKYALAKEGQT